MVEDLPFYLRRGKVMEITGLDSRVISKMVAAGRLTGVRLHPGGRLFFYRDEVLKLMKGVHDEE